MSRTDKALLLYLACTGSLVCSYVCFWKYNVWNMAISTHLQVYPRGTRYVSIAPC